MGFGAGLLGGQRLFNAYRNGLGLEVQRSGLFDTELDCRTAGDEDTSIHDPQHKDRTLPLLGTTAWHDLKILQGSVSYCCRIFRQGVG